MPMTGVTVPRELGMPDHWKLNSPGGGRQTRRWRKEKIWRPSHGGKVHKGETPSPRATMISSSPAAWRATARVQPSAVG